MPIPERVRQLMQGTSWRPGCPVGFEQLRLVEVTHRGFDGEDHAGRLVVHRSEAKNVLRVFRTLYRAGFPIQQMLLVDRFDAVDKRSMAANNTSAFNCRWRDGVCCTWSQHAYGTAIDINPLQNPYAWGGGVSPPAGVGFLDRENHRRGMIQHGDEVWLAFRDIGWSWGGDWEGAIDYQHFSRSGE